MADEKKYRDAKNKMVRRILEHNEKTGVKSDSRRIDQDMAKLGERLHKERAATGADNPQPKVEQKAPTFKTARHVINFDPNRKKWV